MLKTVIFDLDGVITDTAEFHYLGWRRLAEELSLPFDREINEKLKGVSRRRSFEIVAGERLGDFTETQIADFLARKNGYYLDFVSSTKLDLLPGIDSLLRELSVEGIKMAVASASRNTKTILAGLTLPVEFDAVVDGNDVKATKPDPNCFLLAAERTATAPADCVVIEDAAAGIKGAKRAGMCAIGVGKEQNLPGANVVVPSTAGLTMSLLREICRTA